MKIELGWDDMTKAELRAEVDRLVSEWAKARDESEGWQSKYESMHRLTPSVPDARKDAQAFCRWFADRFGVGPGSGRTAQRCEEAFNAGAAHARGTKPLDLNKPIPV
jgi:hypothetical protein